MRKVKQFGWLIWLFPLVLMGCSSSAQNPERTFKGKYPIKVTVTIGMVADLVRNIGGEHVEMTQLMGEGVDPHLYKPSQGDISELNKADIVFYSGRNLEGKMGDIFVNMARRKPTWAVTNEIDDSLILEDEETKHFDPHLWFDVSLWSQGVEVVRKALAEFDPKHAEAYAKNAKEYQKKLADLHEYAKKQIELIPKDQRVMVTAHDAFRYFGRAYGIEVRGIQGISTESEAGLKEVNELVTFLTQRKIKAVFVESSVSDKNIRSLVEGCERQGHKVLIGGSLFSDAMGKDGTPEGTYEGMVRHNVDTIVKALR